MFAHRKRILTALGQGLHTLIPRMPRKNVETNWSEMGVAVMLANPDIVTVADLKATPKPQNLECPNMEAYKEDLMCRKEPDVQRVMDAFRGQIPAWTSPIRRVFLVGKHVAKYPSLVALNNGNDVKNSKADVYLEFEDGTYAGISCKASKDATLTNFSVEKMFDPVVREVCAHIRTTLLKRFDTLSDDETARNFFHGVPNEYWSTLRTYIRMYESVVTKTLVAGIYAHKTPYAMYEFNGSEMVNLSSLSAPKRVEFREFVEHYQHAPRAAKMFYLLKVDDASYRVEVRWKGHFRGSPQFLTHRIYAKTNGSM